MSKVLPFRYAIDTPARVLKIDRFGELRRLQAINDPIDAEAKLLSEEIQSWHKDAPGDVLKTEHGALYQIQLSARRKERTITDKKKAFALLKKALGLDGLIAVIDIGMAVLDKSIPKSAQALFVTEEHSGYRTLTVVAENPATELKAA